MLSDCAEVRARARVREVVVGGVDESADVARNDRVSGMSYAIGKLAVVAPVANDVRRGCTRPLGVAVGDELAVDDALQQL